MNNNNTTTNDDDDVGETSNGMIVRNEDSLLKYYLPDESNNIENRFFGPGIWYGCVDRNK